jgi:catechol 2,3-dioxygenase-like lactoylglutathione lyase family enzyme
MIHSMNHFTIVADDAQATTAYYCGLLGLAEGWRPDLGFPGAWLYAGGAPILHIIYGRKLPEPRTGVIDHMAFSSQNVKAVKARFDAAGVPYTLRRQRESNIWQLFSFDPNGARVELNFDPAEEL